MNRKWLVVMMWGVMVMMGMCETGGAHLRVLPMMYNVSVVRAMENGNEKLKNVVEKNLSEKEVMGSRQNADKAHSTTTNKAEKKMEMVLEEQQLQGETQQEMLSVSKVVMGIAFGAIMVGIAGMVKRRRRKKDGDID